MACSLFAHAQAPPIYVTLWFDTEDYVQPRSDDAAKRLAEMLTRLGVKATFKVVGEKARVLQQRGRYDVISALRRHEIGYHSNLHSQHPTPAEYLQYADWNEGVDEFYRRELSGVQDVTRVFGGRISCYGQPGSSWAPQVYPALKKLNIEVYLDEADYVGINDQPFYYGGLLNIFKMKSNLCRMELFGKGNLEKGKAKFIEAYERLKLQGGGTISIYYHPCEWVHTEFWDAANFSRGANPARAAWKIPAVRAKAETDQAFKDFEDYITFIKKQDGISFVTASELRNVYADNMRFVQCTTDEVLIFARALQKEITFQRLRNTTFSSAELFWLLNESLQEVMKGYSPPEMKNLVNLAAPTRSFRPAISRPPLPVLSWAELKKLMEETSEIYRITKQVPNEIWLGSVNISPDDYLATLAKAYEEFVTSKQSPTITIQKGNFTADSYVANDAPELFNWIIHPEGFHAPKIIEYAKLQAWTLKPAVLKK